MRKLVEEIDIRVRVMIARMKWVDPTETLTTEGFRKQLLERVDDFLPVWDGYRQDFAPFTGKTDSVDGESAHNWYELDEFKHGWFLTPDGELNVYVHRGKDTVEKYTYKSR
jgi:hypothetical protein